MNWGLGHLIMMLGDFFYVVDDENSPMLFLYCCFRFECFGYYDERTVCCVSQFLQHHPKLDWNAMTLVVSYDYLLNYNYLDSSNVISTSGHLSAIRYPIATWSFSNGDDDCLLTALTCMLQQFDQNSLLALVSASIKVLLCLLSCCYCLK